MDTEVTGVEGYIGCFQVALSHNGNHAKLPGGAIIVATGAKPAETKEFLYGKSDRVMTQLELEKRLHEGKFITNNQNVVMIQCVGLPQ